MIPSVALSLNSLAVVDHVSRDTALADFAAQNEAETLRSEGYNALSSGTTPFTLPATIGSPKSASYTITNNTPDTGVKQIDINISYTEYTQTRSLNYRTYISELGVGQ